MINYKQALEQILAADCPCTECNNIVKIALGLIDPKTIENDSIKLKPGDIVKILGNDFYKGTLATVIDVGPSLNASILIKDECQLKVIQGNDVGATLFFMGKELELVDQKFSVGKEVIVKHNQMDAPVDSIGKITDISGSGNLFTIKVGTDSYPLFKHEMELAF